MTTPEVGVTDLWTLAVIAGLTVVSVLTRSFFFISSKPWHLPAWATRGLQYAPIAALAAVIVPEIVMTPSHGLAGLHDARLYAAAAGLAWYFWRKGTSLAMLGTIVVGMAVYLPLHVGWGW